MRLLKLFGFLLILGSFLSPNVVADDWPQWMGPNRDGRWNESGVMTEFTNGGPKVLWRQPIQLGYAGPAVVGAHVYVMDFVREQGTISNNPGKRDLVKGKERVLCLDAQTGKSIWEHAYEVEYNFSYPGGPRATPTVHGDYVLTQGAQGHFFCLNRQTGKIIWKKNFLQEYAVKEPPFWGYAAHPLVHDETVFCIVGGEGSVAVAFDLATGEEKWKALTASEPGYCPPTLIEAGGTTQLLVWHPESLNSLDPKNGKTHWSVELAPAYKMAIVGPTHSGEHLLATALQGSSILLKLNSKTPEATEIWRGKGTHPDHNPPLIVDGYIYGVDVKGRLRCIELETGNRIWESLATCNNGRPASSTTGFLVKNKDHFYITTETGDLVVAQLTPQGYKEKGRFHMIDPTSKSFGRTVVWSHPAFANRCVYARNDKEIVCYSLAE